LGDKKERGEEEKIREKADTSYNEEVERRREERRRRFLLSLLLVRSFVILVNNKY
jgi:hypothetical protein